MLRLDRVEQSCRLYHDMTGKTHSEHMKNFSASVQFLAHDYIHNTLYDISAISHPYANFLTHYIFVVNLWNNDGQYTCEQTDGVKV